MEHASTTGKPIECLAAVAWGPKQPQSVEKIIVDTPKEGEVRVKMVSAGICHSDLSHGSGEVDVVEFPVVLGHEGCGIVESIGPGVKSVKPGDSVIPLWKAECEKCDLCKHPDTNLCVMLDTLLKGYQVDGTVRMSKNGKPITQLVAMGCFSEYCVMPECCVVKINNAAPLLKIPSFGCCFPTGYGAAVNTAGVKPGQTAVVFGLGSVGLCAVLGCRDAGAKRIIGVDTNSDKCEIGKKFGCTDFINPKDHEKPVEQVLKELTGDQLDIALVAVGNPGAVLSAVSATRIGLGKTVVIGIMHGKDTKVSVVPFDLLLGKTLTGTWCGGCNCLTDIPRYVDSYMKGNYSEVDLLTSGLIPLQKINEGFQQLEEGKTLRTIIKF